MEEILAQARKEAEEAEVFLVSSEETEAKFEANRLKHLQTKQRTNIALRIIKDGRIGYATATDLSDPESLIASAVETARFGMVAKFRFPSASSYPQVSIYDSSVKAFTTEKMIALGEELISLVLGHTADLVCDAGVTKGVVSINLLNSRGGRAHYEKTFFSLGLEGNLVRGKDMLFVGESQSSCHPDIRAKNIAKIVIEQLELAKNRASAPTKSLPVIFTPNGVGGALVMPLMVAFNGKVVLEGASPIGNRLGQQVFDKKLSLWDDPTVFFRPSSRPCDDEGVPSQRTPLIENGVVMNFLYDLQTAALAGKESTGSGSRARGGQPAPSPSAFVIAPGDVSFEEMVADVKEGLVVEQLMGAEQGNILGGDFSGNVLLGYKIENGKTVGRVKDTVVSGNVYQVLKEVAAVGKEAKWVGSFIQTPHIYCPSLSVASKG